MKKHKIKPEIVILLIAAVSALAWSYVALSRHQHPAVSITGSFVIEKSVSGELVSQVELQSNDPLAKQIEDWFNNDARLRIISTTYVTYVPAVRIKLKQGTINFITDYVVINLVQPNGQIDQTVGPLTDSDRTILAEIQKRLTSVR